VNPEELSRKAAERKLEWSALEYEEKERSPDWFWALGVIIVASSLTAIIYGNYFFALLIVLSGVLLWFFAIRRPDIIYYELNDQGLKIRTRLYPYENIKSFFVQINSPIRKVGEPELKPLLFIKSERLFMPIISVPIEEPSAEKIHNMMIAHNVPEEEMREHISEKIMEFLGF
jgi:hypothetical protein